MPALLCAVFSVIYEAFSHEVYSPWMVGLCVVSFALGTLPAALLARMRIHVGWLVSQPWACAVLTLTLGCCFAGVLEIYGTTSPWLPVFLAAGGLLALSTVLAMRLRRRKEYGRG